MLAAERSPTASDPVLSGIDPLLMSLCPAVSGRRLVEAAKGLEALEGLVFAARMYTGEHGEAGGEDEGCGGGSWEAETGGIKSARGGPYSPASPQSLTVSIGRRAGALYDDFFGEDSAESGEEEGEREVEEAADEHAANMEGKEDGRGRGERGEGGWLLRPVGGLSAPSSSLYSPAASSNSSSSSNNASASFSSSSASSTASASPSMFFSGFS